MSRETDPGELRRQAAEHLRRLAADGLWGMPRVSVPVAAAPRPEPVVAAAPPGAEPVSSEAVSRQFAAPVANSSPSMAESIEAIEAEALQCTTCRLCETRTKVVFGTGNPRARLMFIGEAPGRDEDLRGEPFVGAAGQLLDRMIVAMGLDRSRVYIANTVKCRPPQNRNPSPEELDACRHYLDRQVAAVRPELIVLLGRVAAQAVLDTDAPLGRLRGRFAEWRGIPVMCTYHPAYLLRTPGDKRKTWEDLQQVMARLGLQGS